MTSRAALPIAAVAAALFVPFSHSTTAGPDGPEMRCEQMQGARPWTYCVMPGDGSRLDVIYHLHGAGADAKSWVDRKGYAQSMRARWKDAGIGTPTVISVSFGKVWLLVEKNESPDSGLLEVFADQAIPEIERRLGFKPERRFLLGVSMGGFNASALLFKRPGLFDRAALVCPAFSTVAPDVDDTGLSSYTRRTKASKLKIKWALNFARRYFPTSENWARSNPIELAKGFSPSTPKLYVSCGKSDEFGFYEGASTLAELARLKGVQTVWKPLDGGHCAVDPDSLADFLGA